jgi:signal transduction histidine kinase
VPGSKDTPIRIERPRKGEATEGVDISIGKDGIRITPRTAPAASAPAAAGPAASAAGGAAGVHITLPPGANTEAVRDAVEVARREIEDALRDARKEAEQARAEAEQARADAEEARADAERVSAELGGGMHKRVRKTRIGIGDFLMQFTVLWVLGSALIKATYKGRIQAERQAARATETAEAESLKRQVVEARMAAMQAQVEPHFLFNTLASIDHLIETDPARASQMQRNLIALLRASMPTMREAAGNGEGGGTGLRDLGRELAVIRPYLEILKVRMEERLTTEIDIPEGLHSAEFPPMMIQTLVENAIKHGLEPKAEGGQLSVRAQIVHGKLQVTVADTGLGFGRAATAGTGVGLANIRERLQLIYGPKAALTVSENTPSGTVVTITVPYKTVAGMEA